MVIFDLIAELFATQRLFLPLAGFGALTPMRRKESPINARNWAVQLHELGFRSPSVHVDQQPTLADILFRPKSGCPSPAQHNSNP
jgi:hypothetical protein